MTREELTDRMKDLPNPSCRVNLIQQVYDIMNEELTEKDKQIDYAKSIIKSLLDNSDEYAEQRAREFLKE